MSKRNCHKPIQNLVYSEESPYFAAKISKTSDMKKIKLMLLLLCSLLAGNMQAQKQAILLAQFGTSNTEGRTRALDVIFEEVKAAHPEAEVREAYTSPTIRRILDKKGIHKDDVTTALLRLHLDGYDEVWVQPTFLLDGIEMNMLREDVSKVSHFFKKAEVGTPLLYTIDDFKNMVALLEDQTLEKGEAVLYVGHGNNLSSTATYPMMGQMLQASGKQFYMGTVEGWPDLETSVAMLPGKKVVKKVKLIPFLLACGVHAHEDIDGEWRPALEKAGYEVEVVFQGLGELPEVRQLLYNHIHK